ncbi:hypothetical protein [Paenibacillus gansuensis]|uniref:Uncharacterized protein n=1 Tax=Paenibacillus gansuensis TaxID=306542 RepID=A0ABW5PDU5_9BACL
MKTHWNGKEAILPIFFIYGFKIVNNSNKNITLESVNLEYEVCKLKKTSEPYFIQTNKLNEGNEAVLTIHPESNTKIYLTGWSDINSLLGKLIESQAVISSGIVFPLESTEEAELGKKIYILIRDFSGKTTRHKIEISKEFFQYKKILFINSSDSD